jgi:beta-mannosidase
LLGLIEIADAPLWWPHTHGAPALLDCRLELQLDAATVTVDCGRIGFKTIHVDRRDGRIQLQVNGVPVFCRGACWTVNDFDSLRGAPAQLRRSLELARAAGVNLLRIGGTMVYECDEFYALCDVLGILVWQDFMFANMDYPVADAAFRRDNDAEITAQFSRQQKQPCIAVYCGGSEIEQQAAMLGLPADAWSNEFFSSALPERCAQLHPGIPYFPSTPWGGALPFHVASGISHYYGVGAYRRPLSDVKHAGVKFTAECLGFSNVPEPATMDLILDGIAPVPHHPAWKARVPRDSGTGWDFEDIRDHYLQALFRVDPIALRSRDPERYFALSRAVTGEIMKAVFAEWRRPDSSCGGALVWFFKDLRPGAGWGIIDSENRPKAVYYYLKRAWARRALLITDEGLDGLQLHVLNEHAEPLRANVELEVLQTGKIQTASAMQTVEVPAGGSATLIADTMLPYFSDLTYSYRFGPPKHDVVVARLLSADSGAVLSEDYYFPESLQLARQETANINAAASFDGDGAIVIDIEADVFLQCVCIDADGYDIEDNYFHLAPRRKKRLRLRALGAAPDKFKGYLSALNLREIVTLRASAQDRT